jgi:hypothetical protein
MVATPKIALLFVFSVVPFLAGGCGGDRSIGDPQEHRRKAELAEIYEIYTGYAKRNQRPPRQWSDLNQAEFQGVYPIGFQALQSGQYIAVWGVSGKDEGTVLAYEKDAPAKGGMVLMADGTVKTMSANELQAALKPRG